MKRRIVFLFVAVLLLISIGSAQAEVLPSGGGSGAIFTTTPDGAIVNENVHYAGRQYVYLDGGPKQNAPAHAAGLEEGFYVFQITDPPGKLLLSRDPARCRIVHINAAGVIDELMLPTDTLVKDPDGKSVFDYTGAESDYWEDSGRFDDELCQVAGPLPDSAPGTFAPTPDITGVGRHDTNPDLDHNDVGAIVVQMMPYGLTPNPGGVYKAWLTPIQAYVTVKGASLNTVPSKLNAQQKPHPCYDFCAKADPGFVPSHRYTKTDNFKVTEKFPAEIKVRKFEDVNYNGLWDAGEPEIGVDIFVDADGKIADKGGWPYYFTEPLNGTTKTDTFYTPGIHVAGIAGIYSAEEYYLPGWKQTASWLDGAYQSPFQKKVDVTVLAVAPGETHEIRFGNTRPGEVYGRKVIDLKADGSITGDTCPLVPDPWGNNKGCQGVTVKLDGVDGMGNAVHLTTLTDANGYYKFTNIWPGSYTITVVEPSGFYCSYPATCNYTVGLKSGESKGSYDFGDFSKVDLYGRKVIDITGNGPSVDDTCPLVPDPWGNNKGCQGVTVNLTGTDNMGKPVSLTTTTGSDGKFSFLDLWPGTYKVTVTEPDGYFCSYPNPCEYSFTTVSDEIVKDLFFGDVSKGEIKGRKVIDIYADGPTVDDTCPLDPDPWGNNAGCVGVTVKLDGTDGKGNLVNLSTTTGADGTFKFTDLWPGSYAVTVVEPPGFYCSYPVDCKYNVSLISDEIASGKVFGDYSKVDIEAYKFFDFNESGTPDPGEFPLANVEFCLYQGAVKIGCKWTGADGKVSWIDLMPGEYTVKETLPVGWFTTTGLVQTKKLMSDEIWKPKFGNVYNCVGLTPGYWKNWRNHYTDEQFKLLLVGTIASNIAEADDYLNSPGCDNGDAIECMRMFLLANQLTINLTQHPELPNPSGGSMFYACQVPGYDGNIGYWLAEALAIHAADGVGYTRDYILWVKSMLDYFANLNLFFGP